MSKKISILDLLLSPHNTTYMSNLALQTVLPQEQLSQTSETNELFASQVLVKISDQPAVALKAEWDYFNKSLAEGILAKIF